MTDLQNLAPTARLVLMVAAANPQPLSYRQLSTLTGASPGTLGKIIPTLVKADLLVRTTARGMSYFSTPGAPTESSDAG
jgi:DNA-binding IscR family transcriptional regulator